MIQFAEKPKGDELEAMKVDTQSLGLDPEEAKEKPFIASMGIYVFKKKVLAKLLNEEYTKVRVACYFKYCVHQAASTELCMPSDLRASRCGCKQCCWLRHVDMLLNSSASGCGVDALMEPRMGIITVPRASCGRCRSSYDAYMFGFHLTLTVVLCCFLPCSPTTLVARSSPTPLVARRSRRTCSATTGRTSAQSAPSLTRTSSWRAT